MHKNAASVIREQLDFQCTICTLQYDLEHRFPSEICPNGHLLCDQCLNKYMFKKAEQKCPYCAEQITKQSVKELPKLLVKKILFLMQEIRQKDNKLLLRIQEVQNTLKDKQEQLKKALEKNASLQNANNILTQLLKNAMGGLIGCIGKR